MMNETVFRGKWNQVQGDIRHVWAKLTPGDMEKVKGDLNQFYDVVQEKYGIQKEQINSKLEQILSKKTPSDQSQSNQSQTDSQKTAQGFGKSQSPTDKPFS